MAHLSKNEIEKGIDAARGLIKCDLVLRGAKTLDVFSGQWLSGDVGILGDKVVGVGESYNGKKTINLKGKYLVPGFIDSHVHIESTLMVPSEFEKTVLGHGTTSAILDPHEIANVLGTRGIEYILKCSEQATMDLYVMLSSCVPATHLETSGATLSAKKLLPYKNHPKVLGLAEMMNYPGVLFKNSDVIEKIYQFQDQHIDGHSPLLRGKDLNAYIGCGIKTDHESVSIDEAQEKLERGMQVMLREGSVAKNLRELMGVLNNYSSPHVSLCTDDRNPLDILDEGHLDYMIRVAIKGGITPQAVYRAASLSTAKCFGIKNKGAIAPGYIADVVVLKDYKKCLIEKVFKSGQLVDTKNLKAIRVAPPKENTMKMVLPKIENLQVSAPSYSTVKAKVIGIVRDNIVTDSLEKSLKVDEHGYVQRDLKQDILKISVIERYGHKSPPSIGFVKGMGIKKGAIASSVGHDSHNAVAIGSNDQDMITCYERLAKMGGGFVVVNQGKVTAELPLPIAGLMTPKNLKEIYRDLKKLRKEAKALGCKLPDPFLQMAFLCLAVIPTLKITDKGLVDVDKFDFVPVITH